LFLLDRIIHKIKLIKNKNKVIISDRTIICGIAYAYANSKFALFFHKLYYNKRWLIPIPDLIFYIIPKFNVKEKEFGNDFRDKVEVGYNHIVPNFYPNIQIIKINNEFGKLHIVIKEIFSNIYKILTQNKHNINIILT